MPSIIIAGEVYEWTPECASGSSIGPFESLLTEIYLQRVTVRARYFVAKTGAQDRTVIQDEITRIATEFEFTDEPEPDVLELEALEIAEETIRARLAEAGLPAPRSLRDHAQQIVDEPSIVAEARRRVSARAAATRDIFA